MSLKIIRKLFSSLSTPRGFVMGLSAVLLFATVTRVTRLSTPSTYFFDEVYHGVTSKLIARNDPRAYEWWNEPVEKDTAVDWLHPPLAKYTQALSMRIFGENSFGWRFSSAFFGVLVIAMTAACAQVYFHRRVVSLLAAILASLDGLLLSQSRIAMNDIHVTFFILTTLTVYGLIRARSVTKKQNNWLLCLSGVLAGLAISSKWSGVFVLLPLFMGQALLIRKFRQVITTFIFFAVVPALIYLSSYTHMFLQGKTLVCTQNQVVLGQCYCSQTSSIWVKTLVYFLPQKQAQIEALEARGGCKRLISHFSELHHQIIWYQTNLKATHPYQSRPWEWVFDTRPVWQYVDYSQISSGKSAQIYNVGNPLLFIGGFLVTLIFILILCMQKWGTRQTKLNWENKNLSFLIFCYFVVWLPWVLSPRIMFFYHYTPSVPLLSIFCALMMRRLWRQGSVLARTIALSFVVLTALTFLVLFPLNTALSMPQSYFETIFSLFPFWK